MAERMDSYRETLEGVITMIDSGNVGDQVKIIATDLAQVTKLEDLTSELTDAGMSVFVGAQFGSQMASILALASQGNWGNVRILAQSALSLLPAS